MILNATLRGVAWTEICDVDVSPLAEWVETQAVWPSLRSGQPQRIRIPDIAGETIEQVLRRFAVPVLFVEENACLSQVMPGNGHGFHRDGQPDNWITRVHVPILTNPKCWFAWTPELVHFERGKAYAFNTLIPHAFGNDGDSARVHLTFDVLGI